MSARMQNPANYWTAWMAGWVSATRAMLQMQQRAMEMMMPSRGPSPMPAGEWEEAMTAATAGDKPRRRGRPPKESAGANASRRRRGRPRKTNR
jgi:hypothetical protein